MISGYDSKTGNLVPHLVYYNGLAFDRAEGGKSSVFLSRFIDRNNQENGDPVALEATRVVSSPKATHLRFALRR